MRDSATGVPMTSAGQASGAVQSDDELVSSMGFSSEDWNLFRNTVAQIESGGTYDISGGSGDHYDGRYQLGAAAKTDGARYAGVADPGHGEVARESFRKNKEILKGVDVVVLNTLSTHTVTLKILSKSIDLQWRQIKTDNRYG